MQIEKKKKNRHNSAHEHSTKNSENPQKNELDNTITKFPHCKKNDVSHHDFDVLEPFLIVSMESTTPGSIGLVKADFASTGSS